MSSKKEVLTEEQIIQCREAFSLFDKDGTGHVSRKYLGTLLRAVGRNPTDQELENFLQKADPDNKDIVCFESFIEVMNHIPLVDSTAELLEAFQFFDKDGTGFLRTSQLRDILMSLGETFLETEVEELVRLSDENNTGYVKYEDFAKVMTLG